MIVVSRGTEGPRERALNYLVFVCRWSGCGQTLFKPHCVFSRRYRYKANLKTTPVDLCVFSKDQVRLIRSTAERTLPGKNGALKQEAYRTLVSRDTVFEFDTLLVMWRCRASNKLLYQRRVALAMWSHVAGMTYTECFVVTTHVRRVDFLSNSTSRRTKRSTSISETHRQSSTARTILRLRRILLPLLGARRRAGHRLEREERSVRT